MPKSSASIPPLLDSRQLVRIEAVHRGFLFQHLYALACLFGASKAGASEIIVERDEDIEIVLPQKRIYVQVKTRAEPLVLSDIQSALDRFDTLRAETREQSPRRRRLLFLLPRTVNLGLCSLSE